jgi:hypothetical protein
MELSRKYTLSLSKGVAAAHVYMTINNDEKYQLTLDWSFDGVYFKNLDNTWIVLSIGPKTKTHDIDKIDTDNKIAAFKIMALHFISKLQDYSIRSDVALIGLQDILDTLL